MSIFHEAVNPSDVIDERIMECNVSASVGDLVYQSSATDNKALVASNNSTASPIIGRIKVKITSTSCKVQFRGQLTGLSGLTRGKVVWLSTTGGFTTTPTTSNFLQALGISFSSTEMFFNPTIGRVKRF